MKKSIIYLFFIFSNILAAQTTSNLFYEKSIYSIEIKLSNKTNNLELDKTNTIEIKTKNIEPVNLMASGKNLKIVKANNQENISYWVISPKNEDLIAGNYTLAVTFRGKKGRLYHHKFCIPVK